MAYCTNAQVALEFKGMTFSASTAVLDTTVDAFIAEADAEINSILSQKYVTPITGAEALLVCRSISIGIVAARIKEILAVKSGKTDVDTETRAGDSATRARALLSKIMKGDMNLTDATLIAGSTVSSYNYSNEEEHTFRKGENQW